MHSVILMQKHYTAYTVMKKSVVCKVIYLNNPSEQIKKLALSG